MNDISIFTKQLELEKIEKGMLLREQVDIPVEHTFSGGVYIRQVFIPKGTIIMGKRHRFETCNILVSGELSLYAGDNMPINRVKGPYLFTSKPFTKKLAYCHEDAIFMNIHPTEKTNLDEIEEQFIIPEEEYKLFIEGDKLCLG